MAPSKVSNNLYILQYLVQEYKASLKICQRKSNRRIDQKRFLKEIDKPSGSFYLDAASLIVHLHTQLRHS